MINYDNLRVLRVSIIVNYYLLAFKFNEYLNSNSFYSQRFSQVHEFSQVQVVSRTLWRASKTGLILDQTVRERTFQKWSQNIWKTCNWMLTGCYLWLENEYCSRFVPICSEILTIFLIQNSLLSHLSTPILPPPNMPFSIYPFLYSKYDDFYLSLEMSYFLKFTLVSVLSINAMKIHVLISNFEIYTTTTQIRTPTSIFL